MASPSLHRRRHRTAAARLAATGLLALVIAAGVIVGADVVAGTQTAGHNPLPALLPVATLDDPSVSAHDRFGHALAVDAGHIVVGAPGHNHAGVRDAGEVHVFARTTRQLLYTLNDPTPRRSGAFGFAVALSGNRLLVGAPGHGAQRASSGAVHVFALDDGRLLATINNPTPGAHDRFGYTLAADERGRVLIGAPEHSSHAPRAGRAHLFLLTAAGRADAVWTFDDPTPADSELFGNVVAIGSRYALIGVPRGGPGGTRPSGQVQQFDLDSGRLVRTIDDPTPGGIDAFGAWLASDGTHLLVGAPNQLEGMQRNGEVHLFDLDTGHHLTRLTAPQISGDDAFGLPVAVGAGRLLAGALGYNPPDHVDTGRGYVFDLTTHAPLAALDDPTPTGVDNFASALVVFDNQVIAGAPGDDSRGLDVGQVHVFELGAPVSADTPAPGSAWPAWSAGVIGAAAAGAALWVLLWRRRA